ncbi:MAG: type IX secretion system membrane protein PorP/SprF [Bacteroidota bacterium]|nr:type IX secretion system membrane protein PorP/SprF [Bacteroidota bacterium]
MWLIKKLFLIFLISIYCIVSFGQQVPHNPISYRLFSPFLFNPAIAGSKDFFSLDMIAGFRSKSNSEIISANTRVTRKIPEYVPSGRTHSFTNFGLGGFTFNDYNNTDSTHNSGIGVTLAYHIPLNKKGLTFLSIGASVKGMYHFREGNSDLGSHGKEFYYPNIDFGIYLYGPGAYAGLSSTNFLDRPVDSDTLSPYQLPISRQYNFIAGYKFVLSRSMNIIFEPSVIVFTDDSLSFNFKENIEPILKLYAGNFCLGTYFSDYSNFSFFFQYRYPRFYVGTFIAMPKNSPYYKKSLTAEITLGINLSGNKSGYLKPSQW